MTFPTVVNTNTSLEDAANVTSHTVNLPASLVSGNLLIVGIAVDGGVSNPTATGWTGFGGGVSGGAVQVEWFYRVSDGAEGASVEFTTDTSERSAHFSMQISGAEDPATQAPETGGSQQSGTSTAPNAANATPTGGAKDYLWIASEGHDRNITTDGFPTNYTANQVNTAGAGANSAGIAAATRNLNAASEDVDAFTLSASEQWHCRTLIIHPVTPVFDPDADAFRLYDDGTESGSSPKAAQDTDIILDATGDAQFHLRYRVQETGGVSGASTDDYALEVSKNSGAFAAVTGASSNVQSDTASGLVADAVTTNRATDGITDGTGSFVAGEQEETNGVIEDRQLTASNFTEHVWACKLIDADLGAGDTLDFRMTLNGGSPGMTNSVTPRVSTPSFDDLATKQVDLGGDGMLRITGG